MLWTVDRQVGGNNAFREFMASRAPLADLPSLPKGTAAALVATPPVVARPRFEVYQSAAAQDYRNLLLRQSGNAPENEAAKQAPTPAPAPSPAPPLTAPRAAAASPSPQRPAMALSPAWVSDRDAKSCIVCLKPFRVYRRRHHVSVRACSHQFGVSSKCSLAVAFITALMPLLGVLLPACAPQERASPPQMSHHGTPHLGPMAASQHAVLLLLRTVPALWPSDMFRLLREADADATRAAR